jgi:hypothetical protein
MLYANFSSDSAGNSTIDDGGFVVIRSIEFSSEKEYFKYREFSKKRQRNKTSKIETADERNQLVDT